MKKIFGFGLFVVLILAIGLFITLRFFLGGIVKKGVNEYAPRITQTKVELQGATLSPFSGVGELNGLSVGNPQGWSAGDALRLGKVRINMEPFTVFKDHIVINELIVEQPEFLYETKLVASNIGDLLKNIEQAMSGKAAEAKTKDGKPIKMVVKKLVLTGGKVTVGAIGTVTAVPLPQIDMVDIGVAEGGVTPAQLAAAVMRNVTASVVGAATQALGKGIGGAGGASLDGAKQVGEAIKGIFGGGKKTPEPKPAAPLPQK